MLCQFVHAKVAPRIPLGDSIQWLKQRLAAPRTAHCGFCRTQSGAGNRPLSPTTRLAVPMSLAGVPEPELATGRHSRRLRRPLRDVLRKQILARDRTPEPTPLFASTL
mmetsp:Transcript_69339/g.137048  ORF Transcript_69339/g.137048 Transcript_69339/m.137048 type:complete len:108 (-) Transcript_69339:2051-2374(-)